ncbi:hypothetical protein HQ520_13970, partial [bacterium]|nr:hypothetical protein [bacterium]
GGLLDFVEMIHRYKITGDPDMLAKAKERADEYVRDVVWKVPEGLIAGVSFELMSASPNVPALLNMYEITGESRYLDAARDAAGQLLANGTWVQPRVPEGDYLVDASALNERGLFHDPNRAISSVHGWNHTTRMILGYTFPDKIEGDVVVNRVPEVWERLKDETVPAWLVSRVGRNMEHGTQLAWPNGFDSPNITMNHYSVDFFRIGEYADDDLFRTIGRVENIGTAANYPGYYINNMMTLYMYEDYPYEGPDVTAIEYSHIAPYHIKLTDYLFTQAWAWSGRRIEFPWFRQYKYAYFDNKVYGHAPGTFFDVEGVWPWLKRGLITVDNKQIDWLGARKNDLFCAALMNEDLDPVTVTVTLGEEITGGRPFSGEATLYEKGGRKTTAPIREGKITVTVPARSLVGLTVESAAVKEPAFASVDFESLKNRKEGNAIALPGEGDFGTGHVLQIDPRSWFAYSFIPNDAGELRNATLNYRIGEGNWRKEVIDKYPYEKIVEVSDPAAPFTFYWETTGLDGVWSKSKERTLRPLTAGE